MSAAINPKGARATTEESGPLNWVMTYLASSVGQKIVVALTGLGLVGFLVGHLIGNLKVFSGPESLNKYAYFLKHDIGMLLWIARGGLLGIFGLHIAITLWLQRKSTAARPIGYQNRRSAQASTASKTMLYTGLVIAAFAIFHLAHYTFMVVHPVLRDGQWVSYADLTYTMPDGKIVHDVYSMVISGFTTPWISGLYVVAQVILFVHLSHGIPSSLRTLGLVGKRFEPAAKQLGLAIAAIIVGGNLLIVGAILSGTVKSELSSRVAPTSGVIFSGR